MKYKAFLSKTAISQLETLDLTLKNSIKSGIKNLEDNPFVPRSGADIKKLKSNSDPPLYRLRIGEYRIIFFVMNQEIRVTEIITRNKGYKWLN